MPVSIIFAYSDETKEKAIQAGFKEKVCLVRHEAQEENGGGPIVREIAKFGGASFIAAQSYWGTGPD